MQYRAIALTVVLVAVGACNTEPSLVRQTREVELVNAIRQTLLESVESEKSAVLATTDEESQARANDARRAAAEIDRLRGELRPLIVADGRRDELDKLDAFDATWAELAAVDQRLLALAVANTNLKAARLSAHEGSAALDRFVDTLVEMQRTATQPDAIRMLSQVLVAALRVQPLLLIHIPTADAAEMTRLEQQIRELSGEVDRSLAAARENPQLSPQRLEQASQAWSEYQRVVTDVLRLSRENTNVISFDVSVHEKHEKTKQCLAALSALLAAVESGPRATR
jgi:hypothetical protein